MARDLSHDASRVCGRRCLNFVLPFDPNAPTAFEMSSFLQMVTHAFQCRFPVCYMTAGSLNCPSIKQAVRHCHFLNSMNQCRCLTCRSFSRLYARHIGSCRQPRGQCPFGICGVMKRRARRQQAARAQEARAQAQAHAATDSTANAPQVENASAQQPNDDLSAEFQQNSNVDAEMKGRTSQSSTSTSETLPQKPGEESNAQDRQNPGK